MTRQTITQTKSSYLMLTMIKIFFIVFFFLSTATSASPWRKLAPGIEYQDIGHTILTPWSHIHVFRIDLKNNQFELINAKELKKVQSSIEQFAHTEKAVIAINGGFFDEHFLPLGLRINQHTKSNPIKQISWWGIFQIQDNQASIIHYSQFNPQKNVHFAIQSGPRLLIHKRIPTLKPGHAERTALGITKDGHIILLVTDRAPMTTTTLAKLMRSSPLRCIDALNLDGGSSSQLFAQFGDLQIKVHGFSEISDAIIVKPN